MSKTAFGEIHYELLYKDIDIEESTKETLEYISQYFNNEDVSKMTFLDAGCAGGLFSLTAHKAGFKSVDSFDFDNQLVNVAKNFRQTLNISNWDIYSGSILDNDFLNTLKTYDYVYCWGVVHHTGQMWQAIENIIKKVNPNGYIYFGIYNDHKSMGFTDDYRFGSSKFWKFLKSFFYHSPNFVRWCVLESAMLIYYMVSFLSSGFQFKDFKDRGMNAKQAISDWLFGHPYEFASVDEVKTYMNDNGFNLVKMETNDGLRTNHYLFQRSMGN